MATINSSTTIDNTVKIFDGFYQQDLIVNANEYDVVYSFFRNYASTDTIAKNFTTFLFVISQGTGIPVISLLDDIQGKTGLQVNATIAYYLNSIKNKVVLYGVAEQPVPNLVVQRNIVV